MIRPMHIKHLKSPIFKREASYTIELSLLMPVIIGSIFLILYTTFYLHDICLISRYGFLAAGEIEKCGFVGSETVLYNRFDRDFMTKSLGSWDIERSAFEDEEKITVYVEGRMLSNGAMLSNIINERLFTYEDEFFAYKINEAEYIRESDGV